MSTASHEASVVRLERLNAALFALEEREHTSAERLATFSRFMSAFDERTTSRIAELEAQQQRVASSLRQIHELAREVAALGAVQRDNLRTSDRLADAVRAALPNGCEPSRLALFEYIDGARLRGAEERTLRVAVAQTCLEGGDPVLAASLLPFPPEDQRGLEPGQRWAVRIAHRLADSACDDAMAAWNDHDDEFVSVPQASEVALSNLGEARCRWRNDAGSDHEPGVGGHGSGGYREGGPLLCNDGTTSPTCTCPGWSGCCSHHGGVRGCR